MVCCVCCRGSSTSFHFRCVYTYAKITHTYVRLHSCVALHLALSMDAAANFCSALLLATIFIYLCRGGGIHSLYQRERGRGRERERWRVNGRRGEREGEGGREYISSV